MDELKAAAERWERGTYGFPDWHHGRQKRRDANMLADAYVAEHRADDAEPVTEEWLRSVGFRDGAHGLSLECIGTYSASAPFFIHLGGGYKRNIFCKTRSDVRQLCKALGIELKEQS